MAITAPAADTTKTAAKPAAKKAQVKTAKPATKAATAPVKKAAPAKKVAAAPKPRIDYKAGARVKGTARDGTEHKGFVERVETKLTGSFIYVNIGDKKKPNVVAFRPAKVRGF